ncbi:hypothetical protein G7046_g7644 [Stylonectria norvegica]|nr:hypothetical protein G7046_g7644 [Stylonectria norvegica]
MRMPSSVRLGGSFAPKLHVRLQTRALSASSLHKAPLPRSTLSKTTWIPNVSGLKRQNGEPGSLTLLNAGFVRKAQAGVFQVLPLGLRVQDKIEKLLDKHMQSIGASRVCLPTFSSEKLWEISGRLESASSELFRFKDRNATPLLLGPTHEEEVTSLVASFLRSYKDLPIRLYQTTRKYRDERRPRAGLLRAREFLMKDLYTFDVSTEAAMGTYEEVSAAYKAFFSELKMPFLVAEASSGDMGGNLSHEYHMPHAVGEDAVFSCDSCGYAANDEVVAVRPLSTKDIKPDQEITASEFQLWRGITKDKDVLVNAWYPKSTDLSSDDMPNLHAVKSAVPNLDTSILNAERNWGKAIKQQNAVVVNVVDARLAPAIERLWGELPLMPEALKSADVEHSLCFETDSGDSLNLLRTADGSSCPRCDAGSLKLHRALEVGHTFHLGTRYSEPFGATVKVPAALRESVGSLNEVPRNTEIPLQMGCHGVGVSRIMGAAAEILADEKGLNWPRAIAPYEVVIVHAEECGPDAPKIYDLLSESGNSGPGLDVAIDDRKLTLGMKLKEAEVVGYPVVVVMGKAWEKDGTLEDSPTPRHNIRQAQHFTEGPSRIAGISPIPTCKPTSAIMAGRQEQINLDTLDPQQLSQVKKQLDEELEHLTSSFAQLHGAQNKFRECLRCVQSRAAAAEGSNSVLVPLTNSLYVRGELADADTVLVDVGTGFLVEKKLKSAAQFYEAKVEELTNNLRDLETIVQRKQQNARTIEEVLRQKIMAAQSQAEQQERQALQQEA